MPIDNYIAISQKEQELLEILWCAGRPLRRNEILALSAANRSWSARYFTDLINKLLEKGLVRVTGYHQEKNIVSRQFAPCISAQEYTAQELARLLSMSDSNCLSRVLFYLLHHPDLEKEMLIHELEATLALQKAPEQ